MTYYVPVPRISNIMSSLMSKIFFGAYKIISYPISIIGYICCSAIYFVTQAFKIDVPKQPDDKTFYNTENIASEYVVFLENCMPVNDDHKHHKQHDHSSHDHSSHDHSRHDHSSYDHSSHDHSSHDHSSYDHSSSHHD